jgi:hypothetical protein
MSTTMLAISIMLGIVSNDATEEAITMASIPGQDLQREFLALTRKSQEAALRAIKAWVDTVKTVTPGYEPLADRFGKLRTVNVPYAGKLPTPEEALADAFRLAEHLLDAQRKFAEDLLKATVPLLQGGKAPAAPAAAPEAAPATPQTAPQTAVPAAPEAAPQTAAPEAAPEATTTDPKPSPEPAPEAAAAPKTARKPRAPKSKDAS